MVPSSNYTAFVYSNDVDPEPGRLVPKAKQGRETAAYLSYIVEYYDVLPKYSIFLHANEDQWHNDLFGSSQRNFLPALRFAAVDALGYVNLRCTLDPGCPTSVNPWEPTEEDIEKKDIRAVFPEVYMEILGVGKADVPKHIGNVCCAQFAVTRDRIRKRPRRDYERMLAWADKTTQTDNFGVGWVFEKLWHIIFGMDVIYCPDFNQCRCDVYGWCGPFPSGETFQAVM
nr:hypothetical protein CFP56_70964 [Quercus suber]